LRVNNLVMDLGNVVIRVLVVLLALMQPLIILLTLGDVPSISSIWSTYLQPLFIITNAVTSYFLFSTKRWFLPSLFLLLLTAFSVDFNLILHNTFAGLFFLVCTYSLTGIRRLRWYLIPYLLSGVVLLFFGIFWAEVLAIIIICSYHLHVMYISYCINKKRGV
jgi:hypothetical protein